MHFECYDKEGKYDEIKFQYLSVLHFEERYTGCIDYRSESLQVYKRMFKKLQVNSHYIKLSGPVKP